MKNNTVFNSRKIKFDSENKKINIIFAAAVILILVISCVAILAKNDFNLKAAVGGDIEVSSETTEEASTANLSKSDKYYLLWCTDQENKELKFLWIARVTTPKVQLKVYAPSTDDMVEYEGQYYTIGNLYSIYGEKIFTETLENYYDINFSAYIGSSPEMFKQMINYFGGITVDLEEQIEYKGNFNLILMKGSNTLKGELAYKYLIYTGFGTNTELSDRSEAFILLIEKVFTQNYSQKADTIFSRIVNNMTTNITVMQYSENTDLLNYLFDNGFSSAKAYDNITDLKK
jgi:anionic cell wall polymer biosynthesis LytR-Cps2A-Psr (LCP) family protein